MSVQMTFEDLFNATFLRGSEYGATPCDVQDGPMTGPSHRLPAYQEGQSESNAAQGLRGRHRGPRRH